MVLSGCGSAPLEFLFHLACRRDLREVVVSHATAWGNLPHLSPLERPAHLRFDAYFLPAIARGLHREGKVDYIPLTFSDMERLYGTGSLKADVVAFTCSTPDDDGMCSLGPFVSYLPAAMRQAREVIAECSPRWPVTHGAARFPLSMATAVIHVDREPLACPEVEDQPEAQAIAAHVAGLVPDGATIQIGRGAIPNAIAAALRDHRDLGIHSEMVSDWVVDLHRRGVITGARKKTNPGRIVTGFMDGARSLYRWADANDDLLLAPIYEINDPSVIAKEDLFFAINGAVEVDLTGQINSESAGGHLLSGSGGLLDFAMGASRSRSGRFIVALPATAKGGAISRIVERIGAGNTVTVPRTLADTVVTEHGIAELRGKTTQERTRALIAIAAPEHRARLASQLFQETASCT